MPIIFSYTVHYKYKLWPDDGARGSIGAARKIKGKALTKSSSGEKYDSILNFMKVSSVRVRIVVLIAVEIAQTNITIPTPLAGPKGTSRRLIVKLFITDNKIILQPSVENVIITQFSWPAYFIWMIQFTMFL